MTTTDIATIVSTNPVAVLVDAKTYSEFLEHIKAETAAFVPDLSTATSRAKISALAYKVTRTKTAIDNAGKKLNEEARAQIGKVDEQRRKIRADLEALAESVRKPLTDWETAEETRVAACKTVFSQLEEIGNLKLNGANALFPELFAAVEAIEIDPAFFGELAEQAQRLKESAVEKLTAAREAQAKAEAERLELETLRKAEADRKAREAEAFAEAMKIAAAEKERAAQAERERLAEEATKRAAEEAAEQARAEERRIAAEALANAEREKQEIIAAQERADAERLAREKAAAAEQAAREADKTHRAAIMKSAKEGFMAQGLDESTAKKVVLAIVAGEVANVSVKF
jgi:colicin import membrane protein